MLDSGWDVVVALVPITITFVALWYFEGVRADQLEHELAREKKRRLSERLYESVATNPRRNQ